MQNQQPPVGAGSAVVNPTTKVTSKVTENNRNNNSPAKVAPAKKISSGSVIVEEQPLEANKEVEELPKKTSITIYDKLPNIMEVRLDSTPPSATSTPLSNANLNTKKSSSEVIETSHDTLDLVVNKNFINAAVTGNRYWTNQALQNDNSLKINQVDSDVRKNDYWVE